MSERLAAEILIGGNLSRRHVRRFCEIITAADVVLDWGDSAFHPSGERDLLEARCDYRGCRVMQLRSDDADWGRFPDLEAFCVRHGLPFERRTEGKWEFDPELVVYRPGRSPQVIPTNADGDPVVLAASVADSVTSACIAASHLKASRHATAQRALQQTVRLLKRLVHAPSAPLPEFQIVRSLPSERTTPDDRRSSPRAAARST